jgi:hypothetical protein
MSCTRLFAVLVLVAVGSPLQTAAQPSPAPAPARVPSLLVSVMPGFRVPTFEKAVGAEIALAAEPAPPISITSDAGGACASRLQAPGDPARVEPSGSASWFIGASLVSQEGDQATIDVRWQRRVPRQGVLLESDLATARRLVLRDRGRGILDLVHAVPGAPGICDSFAIALELRFRSPSNDVPDAGFGYDLWLVDRSGVDAAAPVRTRIEARQGIEAPYALPPVTLAGRKGSVRVSLVGAVSGEARADGAVDLFVDTWQSVNGEPRSTGEGGRKRLVVAPGETIEFELPARLKAQLPAELRQHDFALRVTAERLW